MSTSTPLPPEALDGWVAALAAGLGLDPADVPVGTLLDVARDVAHGVARPAPIPPARTPPARTPSTACTSPTPTAMPSGSQGSTAQPH